jgi:glycosyltransferase involved in cell wall biosynthesis
MTLSTKCIIRERRQKRFLFTSLLRGHAWGGSEELWSRAGAVLSSRGHRVLASVEGKPPLADRLKVVQSQGIELICRFQEIPSVFRRLTAKLRRKEADWLVFEDFKDLIRSTRPDLICISNGGVVDDVRFLEVAINAGVKVANISQANAEEWWPNDAYGQRCVSALNLCHGNFFVSQGNLRLWETQTATTFRNASVVRNPVNVSYEAKPNWPASDESWHLACVARLDPRAKGHDLLFRMMALPEWRERPFTVGLFGQGPMEGMLRRLVTSLNLSDRVFFHGHVNKVEEIWEQHHALILPSRYEGLPLALVEAMLCQRTSIVTAVAGNAEVVEDGMTGFIAATPSVKDLSDAMERAWARRGDWQSMGQVAGARIRALIPEDPAAHFADQLETLAAS